MSSSALLQRLRDAATLPPLALKPARVHEATGPASLSFALYQMAQHPGALFWIAPAAQRLRLMPHRLPSGVAERLIFIHPTSEDDLLWSAEEALRADPTGFVVALPEKPLSLTTGRRLQLAAEAGQTTGLLLIREGQGSNAAETRWHCESRPAAADSTRLRWQRIKNKMGTIGSWIVEWDGTSSACHMVDEAPE